MPSIVGADWGGFGWLYFGQTCRGMMDLYHSLHVRNKHVISTLKGRAQHVPTKPVANIKFVRCTS
ncbi:hypothetical protein [Moraxella lacunata]|uniref:hypothetical protein n=1 Tax=Moraxella lacunata TaxID=477 RepID=UPI003EE25C3C